MSLPADTELVGDDALEEVEEALELEEDDGMKLEPFNLAQERQEGFFDEEGHYVEKRDREEEEAEKDAWFSSTKGKRHSCTKGEGAPAHGTLIAFSHNETITWCCDQVFSSTYPPDDHCHGDVASACCTAACR